MEDMRVFRDIVYTQTSSRDLLLDLYLPPAVTELLPLIVWIHGGAWLMGDKEEARAVRMVSQGYAVASISYRLSYEKRFPAQIHDCKAAIRWLRAHAERYNLDPGRIGVWGASAGGHLAALLGTSYWVSELEGSGGNLNNSSRVQAVCDFFGPVDLIRMNEVLGLLEDTTPESLLIGGPLLQNADRVKQVNPITYISDETPPFLIVHGEDDPNVPAEQSKLLYEALLKAQVEATLHIISGTGHGFEGATAEQLAEIDQLVDEFFSKHLKNKP